VSESAAISSEEPSRVAVEVAEQCRADFLRALAYLNLDAVEGTKLAYVLLGQPFASCGPCEIQTAVEAVRDMLRRTTALPPDTQVHA
jgi:hypothetical protein